MVTWAGAQLIRASEDHRLSDSDVSAYGIDVVRMYVCLMCSTYVRVYLMLCMAVCHPSICRKNNGRRFFDVR